MMTRVRCARYHIGVGATLLALWLGACTDVAGVDAAQQLMDLDREFASATAERGAEGWASYFASDGRMYQRVGIVSGREAIQDAMAPAFADPNRMLRWEPDSAFVAASGDLGYTLGRWRLVQRGAGGSDTVLSRGNYVTIWELQDDGSWKVALDIGNDEE